MAFEPRVRAWFEIKTLSPPEGAGGPAAGRAAGKPPGRRRVHRHNQELHNRFRSYAMDFGEPGAESCVQHRGKG